MIDQVNSFLKRWGEQVIRRQHYAAGLALVFSFLSFFDLPLIGCLSSIIIALVTLQNGARQGFSVIIWAILPAVAMLFLGQYPIFIDVFFLQFLAIWALSLLFRKYGSWMFLIQVSAVLGILAVTSIHFFFPELQSQIVAGFAEVIKEYQRSAFFKLRASDMDIVASYFRFFATSLVVLKIIVTNLLLVLLARGWQARVIPNINVQREFFQVRSHYVSALALIALIYGLQYNSTLFLNILIVAILPFVFCGLSVLHSFCARKKNGGIFLSIFYFLLMFLSPYIVAGLTTLGWLDSFLNFRKKYINEDAVQE